LSKVGLVFAGNRRHFKGLGLFFLASDERGKARESIAAIWSDGSRSLTIDDVRRETQAPPGSMKVQPQNVIERLFAVLMLLCSLLVFSMFIRLMDWWMNLEEPSREGLLNAYK